MRYLLINSVCGIGSTGKICLDIAKQLEIEGHEVKIAFGRNSYVPEEARKYAIRIGNDIDLYLHFVKSILFDGQGQGSRNATRKFLKWASEYNPDVLWLHNIHGYYINYEELFAWIKERPAMQVKWTLHDCWAFTGHCAYFTMVKCDKWKEHCHHCPQLNSYPRSAIDQCYKNYEQKKAAFRNCPNIQLITPSIWLADLVKQSYLKEYPVEVRHNTIDEKIYKPMESDFKQRMGLLDKKIVLGLASVWDARKGLKDFYKLADILPDNYQIILVGLNKKQLKKLPSNIIGLSKTNSIDELVKIYSAADVFVNTTYEDNYPTVNLEAQACGTPVITYNTGGSPESVPSENVVAVGNIRQVANLIENRY